MPTPAPSPPTGSEKTIYQGGIKASQIRVDLEVEYPHVTSLLSTVGDDASWYKSIPEGTSITGGLIKNNVSPAVFGVLRPASMWTKEGIVFPADKSIPWTLTWSMRFNYDPAFISDPGSTLTKTYSATAFRVCGIDNNGTIGGSIVGVDGNQYLGTRLGIPDGNWIGTALPVTDTGFHTYTLSWDGSTYSVSGPQGSGTLAGGIAGIIVRGADFISIGVQGITNNVTAIWTEIEVASISISGAITETITYPSWASTHASPFGDAKLFSYLPSYTILGGRVSVQKDNELDPCEIQLKATDPSDATIRNIFTGFRFTNRRVVVSSRQSTGGTGSWTSWKNIFAGVIDEQEYSVTDQGGIELTLRCRDINRRKMKRNLVTKAFADYTAGVTGVPNSKNIEYIMTDLCTSSGLIASDFSITADEGAGSPPDLKPKSINFIGQDALSALNDVCEDIVYEVWCDYKNSLGKIYIRPFTYTASGTADYTFSIHNEVENISKSDTSISKVGRIEVTFENANNSPFLAGYPVNAFHGDDSIRTRPSRLIQEWQDIANTNPFHVEAWKRENRDIGALDVTMTGQDWLEMNMNVIVTDDVWGLTGPASGAGTVYIVDGWDYRWDGIHFTATARLVWRRPQDYLRTHL